MAWTFIVLSYLSVPLWDLLFRLLRVYICAVRFFKGVGALETVQIALIASNAVAYLPRFKRAAIVACRRDAPYATMVLVLATFERVSFISAFVVVRRGHQGVRTMEAKRAVFTIVTEGHERLRRRLNYFFRRLFFLLVREFWKEVDPGIVLRVFRVDRSARRARRVKVHANGARYPQYRAILQAALLRTHRRVIIRFERASSRRQLRGRDQGSALNRLSVRVFHIGVSAQDVTPVCVIRLGLRGVPFRVRQRRVVGRFRQSIG